MTEFNIPSAINHSCFFDYKNELIHLSEAETNYWYALIYLYRTNLLKENKKQKIFLDNGKKTLNPDFNIFKTKIKLSSFNSLGITGKASYKKLERFLLNLTFSKLEVNILGKHKEIKCRKINITNSLYIDENNELHIELSKKLATALLHTKSYFMKVDLDVLFKISGYKAKRLYLLSKDYYNMPTREIPIIKKDLELFIGKIPDKGIFQKVIDIVSDDKLSDISISIDIPKEEFSLATYIIELGELPKKDTKTIQDESTTNEEQRDEALLKEANARWIVAKKRNPKLSNKKGWIDTTYYNLVAEQKEELNSTSEFDAFLTNEPKIENPEELIDEILNNIKKQSEDKINVDEGVPLIVCRFNHMRNDEFMYIDEYYDLITDKNYPHTSNAIGTYKLLNSSLLTFSILYLKDKDAKYSKMYF